MKDEKVPMTFSYWLKDKTRKLIPLVCRISFGYWVYDVKKGKVYKPVKYYPPIKVTLNDWNEVTNLPKSKEKFAEIANFEQAVKDAYQLMELQGREITDITLKNEIDIKLKKVEVVDKLRIRIADFIEDHVETATHLAETTIKKARRTKERILAFEKKIGKPLYASDVDADMYLLYSEHIRSAENVKKNNTLVSYVKELITNLNRIAKKYKIVVFNPTKSLDKKDQLKATIENKVYMTFDDIITLIKYKPKTQRLRNVRLVFLTLLLTGCRFGDVFKIKPDKEYKNEFHYCRFFTHKNNKEVVIPILEPLMKEYEKHGLPTFTHLSDFDLMVKELVKECGITREETLSYTDKSNKKRFETKPFYEFVSSHTGRRSFITNLIDYIPITVLCKITTHELKDNSIIFRYDKKTLLENAALFLEHIRRAMNFFKKDFPLKLV